MDHCIFFLDPGQNIMGSNVVVCGSDIEALAAAGTVGDHDCGVEVWQAARMVGRPGSFGSASLQNGDN